MKYEVKAFNCSFKETKDVETLVSEGWDIHCSVSLGQDWIYFLLRREREKIPYEVVTHIQINTSGRV